MAAPELAAPAAPPPPARRGPPLIGDVNVLEASIGARGSGKSTAQCDRAAELVDEWGGAYVIGHSLGQRLPDKLPDGTALPITYHQTIAALDRGLRRAPGRWHVLAPTLPEQGGPPIENRESADDLIRYVIRLGSAIGAAAYRDAHPMSYLTRKVGRTTGLPATPIVLLIDEGIAVDGAGTSRRSSDKWFLEFIYSLRHLHVALLYAVQEPTARSWRVLEAATAINIYQTQHRWALEALRAAGADEEQIARIKSLDLYERVTVYGGARKREQAPAPEAAP